MTVFVKTFAIIAVALVTNEITAMFCHIGQESDPAMNNKYRWVISVKDPCQCTQVQVGGGSSQTIQSPFKVTYYDCILRNSDALDIHVARCQREEPLGMEDGRIPDDSITASSIWGSKALVCGQQRARPSTTGLAEAWCAGNDDTAPWIQVDFNSQSYITGLITQGRGDNNQWVTRYHVKYSDDGHSWYDLTYANITAMEFVGNVDRHSLVTARFVATLHTRFLRILPTTWYNHCSMRFEVLGCQQLD